MQWWIGRTKLTRCAAYRCMALPSVIFLGRKQMLRDLCVSCLMTWNPEYQCNSTELVLFPLHNTIVHHTNTRARVHTHTHANLSLFISHLCCCFLGCSLLMRLAIKLRGTNAVYDKWECSPIFQGLCHLHCLINLSLCILSMLCSVLQYVCSSHYICLWMFWLNHL